MKVLAIDPATVTGWAHACGESGVWDCSLKKDESSGMRLLRFRSKLNEVKNLIGVDVVAFEAGSRGQRNNRALVVQLEIQGVLKEWCEAERIQYVSYSPHEIKKHALQDVDGKKRTKEKMVQAACNKWPDLNIVDDNHADALHLLDLAMKDLNL